jgi:hypothetical protein
VRGNSSSIAVLLERSLQLVNGDVAGPVLVEELQQQEVSTQK